jgi:hypothetical protein
MGPFLRIPFRQKQRNRLILLHLSLGFGGYAQSNVRAWLRTQIAGEIGMDVETILCVFLMIAIGAFVIW